MSDLTGPHILAGTLATALRADRNEIVRRWLDRIVARVTIEPNKLFPTEELLNHVPLLIDGIAAYIESEVGALDAEDAVSAKARELGALRHAQGFDAYEVLKEHELLAGVLFTTLRDALASVPPEIATTDAVALCWQRAAQAIDQVRQTTMVHFLRMSAEKVRSREERLRRFNLMVSHELKNRIGAIRGAVSLLTEPWIDEDQTKRFQRIIAQNAEALQRVLANLTALSQLDGESRQQRNVLFPQAAQEVARQLRDAAELADVRVELDRALPEVEIDAASVELALANYVSNAIKYADATRTDRWVKISAQLTISSSERPGELVVQVSDNGLGVPEAGRAQLFDQFYRAHTETVTGVEGTGLGLSIVKETIEALGGRVWVTFPDEGGSMFAFSLPSRREEDAAAAGTRRPE